MMHQKNKMNLPAEVTPRLVIGGAIIRITMEELMNQMV